MATTLNAAQKNYLYDLLTRDQNGNHQLLTYYLKLILRNRPLELKLPDGTSFQLSPEESWQTITTWAADNEVSLPMGDRGSRKIRASRLLNYLEINVQGKSREAAANFQAILDSAKQNPLKNVVPPTTEGRTYKKLNELRNLQYQLLNDKILGKLTTDIQKTRYLQKFKNDPLTYSMLSALLAANASNLRSIPGRNSLDVAEEITKLVQQKSGYGSINNAAHLAYAKSAEQDLKELQEVIDERVKKEYGGKETAFQQDMSRLASLSSLTTLADIPTLVDLVAANDRDKAKLVSALQSTIVASSGSGYVSGENILKSALSSAGFPPEAYTHLSGLALLVEEARNNEAKKIISGNIHENDPRLLHTLPLARDIGVSPEITWLTRSDLNAKNTELLSKYKSTNLEDILRHEMTLGDRANFETITEINNHLKTISEHSRFEQAISDNPLFYLRDKIGHVRGSLTAVTSPIDRFSQKIGKAYWQVDDFVHAPFKYIADQWEKLEEKIPILNPSKLLLDKVSGAQLWVAGKILSWSDNLVSKGHWASGLLTHVSDFTRGFVQEGGSWHGANFVFVQKKWGNLLDWGAKKAGYKAGWQGVKAKIGTSLWNGFKKIAPGMAEKAANGALKKLVASLVLGELTAGTSILIQIVGMVIWEGLKGIWKFITNKDNFRTRLIEKLPLILSVASVSIGALPGAIVGGLIAFGSGALAFIGAALSAIFTTIVIPALIAVGSIILASFLLFQIFSITSITDSGLSNAISEVVCNALESDTTAAPAESSSSQSSGGEQNSAVSAAKCIYDFLEKFNLNPLTASNAVGAAWESFVAALGNAAAAFIIGQSATGQGAFQCVGFIAGVGAMIGKGFNPTNACNYVNKPPSGYSWTTKPTVGCFFVVGSSTCSQCGTKNAPAGSCGHVGVVSKVKGGIIEALDANGTSVWGTVRANAEFPTGSIAGYMCP